MTALLNRTPTHLGEPHWQSTPFEYHPKSPLDYLLDTLAILPALLARADRVLAQPHTLTRRLMAQDLLHNCLDLELDLGRWYAALSSSSSAGQPQPHQQRQQPPPPPFWLASNLPAHHTPFPHPLSFRDNPTALALTYHWTALVLFYPTIWRLYFAAVIDPVMDDTTTTRATTPSSSSSAVPTTTAPATAAATNPNMGMGMGMGVGVGMGVGMETGLPQDPSTLPLPPRLQALDPMAYSLGKVREAAANACRGLDFFLVSTSPTSTSITTTDQSASNETWAQPQQQQLDLLWHPLFVASRFYAELGGLGGLGDIADVEMGMEGSGVGGDGRLEMMWCEGCRQTLAARGREVREVVVGGRGWVDVASF